MVITLPVALCLIAAIGSFSFAFRMRLFKVSEKPPASSAGLSMEQRQRRIRVANWMFFGLGWFWVFAALFLAWLHNSN
jgi:hypothetical protein